MRMAITVSCLVVLTVLSNSDLALAEVTIKPIEGPYGNYSVEGVWTQRVVALANDGDKPRLMKFAFLADDPQRGKMLYSRIISIPAKSVRRAHLAYRPGKLTPIKPSTRRNRPVNCEQLYGLWDARSGIQVPQAAETTIKLPKSLTTVSAAFSTRVPGDSFRYLTKLPGQQLGAVQLLTTVVRSLPDVWYGYSMIDIFSLGPTDMSQMRPSQLDALLGWVQRGGLLVLSGSDMLEEMLLGKLGLAAGLSVVGHHEVATIEVTGPGLAGVTSRLKNPLPMVEIQVEQAEVVYLANGLPLMVKRGFGHGHVITLATPLGALEDPKLHRIWREIRWIDQSLPPLNADSFMANRGDELPLGQKALQEIAGRRGATKAVPVAILLTLMTLVLVAGLGLRLKRRGELVWAGLIPLAILLSIGLYVYGQTLSDPQRLSHIGLISGLDDGKARIQQTFAYYSGPQKQDLSFGSGSWLGVVSDIASGGAGVTGELRTEFGTVLPDQTVSENSTSAFYVDSIEAVDGVDSSLSFDSQGLAGTITNSLGQKITDAVLYVNRRTYSIGDLATGPNLVKITSEQEHASRQFTGSATIDPLRKALTDGLLSNPSEKDAKSRGGRPRSISTRPLLVGYTSLSGLDPLGDRELAHQGWSVVVWPLKLTAPPVGTAVSIPAGLVDLKFERTSMWDKRKQQFKAGQHTSSVKLAAYLPASIQRLEDIEATIIVVLNATSFQLIISGGQRGSNGQISPKTEIQTFTNPTGRLEVSVPDAGRFAGPGGELMFHLKIEKLGKKATTGLEQASSYKFESIQVALKGTVQ